MIVYSQIDSLPKELSAINRLGGVMFSRGRDDDGVFHVSYVRRLQRRGGAYDDGDSYRGRDDGVFHVSYVRRLQRRGRDDDGVFHVSYVRRLQRRGRDDDGVYDVSYLRRLQRRERDGGDKEEGEEERGSCRRHRYEQ